MEWQEASVFFYHVNFLSHNGVYNYDAAAQKKQFPPNQGDLVVHEETILTY